MVTGEQRGSQKMTSLQELIQYHEKSLSYHSDVCRALRKCDRSFKIGLNRDSYVSYVRKCREKKKFHDGAIKTLRRIEKNECL